MQQYAHHVNLGRGRPRGNTTVRNDNKIGSRLRKLRLDRGLTQVQLARLADLSRGTVVAIEGGRFMGSRTDTLIALLKALRCSPEALL